MRQPVTDNIDGSVKYNIANLVIQVVINWPSLGIGIAVTGYGLRWITVTVHLIIGITVTGLRITVTVHLIIARERLLIFSI